MYQDLIDILHIQEQRARQNELESFLLFRVPHLLALRFLIPCIPASHCVLLLLLCTRIFTEPLGFSESHTRDAQIIRSVLWDRLQPQRERIRIDRSGITRYLAERRGLSSAIANLIGQFVTSAITARNPVPLRTARRDEAPAAGERPAKRFRLASK